MWQLYILVASVGFFLWYLLRSARHRNEYAKKKGMGNCGDAMFNLVLDLWIKKYNLIDMITKDYTISKASPSKVGISNDMGKTVYSIADVNHLKHILIKDFDHFVDHREFGLKDSSDSLSEAMVVFLTGEKWKQMRSKLSPIFTTGKIKRMFTLFNQSGEKLVKFIESEMKTSTGEMDIGEAYSKFAMDVIANAVCGIDSRAFEQKEAGIFEQRGKKIQEAFGLGIANILKFILLGSLPKVARALRITLFGHEVQTFFDNAIKSLISRREETGEKRDDFIQLMMEAKVGSLKVEESELDDFEKNAQIKNVSSASKLLDDDAIVSNCVLFILAGFDTTQSLLLFFVYSLALYPEVQEKLRAEVDSIFEETNGKLTYDAVSKMTYLDMVINETLRMYPPTALTDRQCTKTYKLPDTDIEIQKGEGITIPIAGLHYDEEFWENPQTFNPERFSPENKSKINPFTFLPFGQGPRNCIGMRFALMEVKVAFSHIIRNFTIQPSRKTNIPMKYINSSTLKPANGMWLAFNKRK